jgi:hypothetical protein
MKTILATFAAVAVIAGTSSAWAQQPRVNSTGGHSPHETTSAVISGDRVTVTYGRPYTKNPSTGEARKIWGGLVPWGEPWRMGSDEATTLITQQPIVFGTTTIPAGAYTLYMIPSETGTSKLVFSKKLGQWGIPVDTSDDLASVDLTKDNVDKTADQYTMAVARNQGGGGVIRMTWENTQFSAAFTVQK